MGNIGPENRRMFTEEKLIKKTRYSIRTGTIK
jgi:hypothetical protein